MKTGYFDCFASAGGDMIDAAMLEAGLNAQLLKTRLATLEIDALDVKIRCEHRCGIEATTFEPVAGKQTRHRNLAQITTLINKSGIADTVKSKAVAIFNKLADAEAAVHGTDPDSIHFHEVGAVDSIVDIVSACIGLEVLGIEQVYCSALAVGGGTAQFAHGLLPVPAPATVELLKGVPIVGGPQPLELLTPTAAAILTTIAERFGPLPAMSVEAVGYGAGGIKSDKFPNVLRLIIGQTCNENSANVDSVCVLEANTDDATGEVIGSVMDKLFEEGALDAFTAPIYMKHNRPAVQISVICRIQDTACLEAVLFEQGRTFGIRKRIMQRSKLAREFVKIDTKFGKIRIKVGKFDKKIIAAKPEFSDCLSAANKHNVAVKTVINAAQQVFETIQRDK